MFEYFYNEIFRKTIISFGTLFNGITIKHSDDNGATFSEVKVPLAYGPVQKFLARIEQDPDLKKPVQISLPRMSFEFTGLQYDATRKVTTTQTFLTRPTNSKTTTKKAYMPVPYNMSFELNILTKLNDDMLQIIEQILPYFQPAYTVTVNLVNNIQEKRDIPIVIENISMQDDYEGDFTTRRALIYTINFTAKTYLFGPIPESTPVIKKAVVDYTTRSDGSRELRYSTIPRAIQDYNNDVVAILSEDINLNDTTIPVDNVTGISVGNYLEIDGEEIYVKDITGNILTVDRGKDNTTASEHVKGTSIKLINSVDNSLIEVGDDFGFSGTTEFFQDGAIYSPSLNVDIL